MTATLFVKYVCHGKCVQYLYNGIMTELGIMYRNRLHGFDTALHRLINADKMVLEYPSNKNYNRNIRPR
jgi:hypothetical protein